MNQQKAQRNAADKIKHAADKRVKKPARVNGMQTKKVIFNG